MAEQVVAYLLRQIESAAGCMAFHGFYFFLVSQFMNLVYQTPSQSRHKVIPQLQLCWRNRSGYQQEAHDPRHECDYKD